MLGLMKITQMLVVGLALAACQKAGPKQDTFPGRQLGESTASPGANASKPQPLTPDDPRVMNVSASISPQQSQQAAPVPAQPRTDATSSTPVQPPADIAPPSTTTETNRPGVFSPPPVSPATQPTSTSPPPPSTAPTPAPTPAPRQ
jgi:hypothetical protein